MHQDIIVKADAKYNFLNCLSDPKKYLPLTDKIINRIAKSDDPLLSESQSIISRLNNRILYAFVDGFYIQKWNWKDAFNTQDIADYSEGSIKPSDIILLPTKFDYGCGTSFPTDLVSFYDSNMNILPKVGDYEYGLSKPRKN